MHARACPCLSAERRPGVTARANNHHRMVASWDVDDMKRLARDDACSSNAPTSLMSPNDVEAAVSQDGSRHSERRRRPESAEIAICGAPC